MKRENEIKSTVNDLDIGVVGISEFKKRSNGVI